MSVCIGIADTKVEILSVWVAETFLQLSGQTGSGSYSLDVAQSSLPTFRKPVFPSDLLLVFCWNSRHSALLLVPRPNPPKRQQSVQPLIPSCGRHDWWSTLGLLYPLSYYQKPDFFYQGGNVCSWNIPFPSFPWRKRQSCDSVQPTSKYDPGMDIFSGKDNASLGKKSLSPSSCWNCAFSFHPHV